MSMIFMRFPNGRAKALTLSYDDGVEQDIKLIEIMNKYGLKGTFNISSGRYAPDGKIYSQGTVHRIMTKKAATELYKSSPHEVAVHAYTHPRLDQIPLAQAVAEIMEDRKNLENDFECTVRGMAYPYGSASNAVADIVKSCGIVYSRTTISTENFSLPKDWLRLPATCHHNNPRLMELTDKFITGNVDNQPQLFYLWGHSYEFEANDNWNVIEDFSHAVGNNADIWYATNIEIYDYIKAYENLIWAMDYKRVTNHSSKDVWFKLALTGKNAVTACVHSGETLEL